MGLAVIYTRAAPAAWKGLVVLQLHDFWRLDYWEDDLRRRRRFVRNPFGSTHLDIMCKPLEDYVLPTTHTVDLARCHATPPFKRKRFNTINHSRPFSSGPWAE
ncbi:hypothetical protein MHYP_G00200900 [Metynnis hypsauchen]